MVFLVCECLHQVASARYSNIVSKTGKSRVEERKNQRPQGVRVHESLNLKRDWHFIAGQAAPAPHLAHPEGCAALRIVLVTVPRVSRSCEH